MRLSADYKSRILRTFSFLVRSSRKSSKRGAQIKSVKLKRLYNSTVLAGETGRQASSAEAPAICPADPAPKVASRAQGEESWRKAAEEGGAGDERRDRSVGFAQRSQEVTGGTRARAAGAIETPTAADEPKTSHRSSADRAPGQLNLDRMASHLRKTGGPGPTMFPDRGQILMQRFHASGKLSGGVVVP